MSYMISQCLGAICGVGLVKAIIKSSYNILGGGVNSDGYNKGTTLGVEIIGTFVLVYTVFSATDPKRSACDSHVPVLAPLPIGFAVFMVHLETIPITGTSINPARSFGAAMIYNKEKICDDHWIFWVRSFMGALATAAQGSRGQCSNISGASQTTHQNTRTIEEILPEWSERGCKLLSMCGEHVANVRATFGYSDLDEHKFPTEEVETYDVFLDRIPIPNASSTNKETLGEEGIGSLITWPKALTKFAP